MSNLIDTSGNDLDKESKLNLMTLDDHLNKVDFKFYNSPLYRPTKFALFMNNFDKLINSSDNRFIDPTPPFHLAMYDSLTKGESYIANVVFRGGGKSNFLENIFWYIATFNTLPGMDEITGGMFVGDSLDNGVTIFREGLISRYNRSSVLQEWLPEVKFLEKSVTVTNRDNVTTRLRLYGVKTGIRGGKMDSRRPQFAFLDDLMKDSDAHSPASINLIKDVIFKGVLHALEPDRRIIACGTPFDPRDVMLSIATSGMWLLNIFPVAERFPVPREEFVGAWEERFHYDYVMEMYEMAKRNGSIQSFFQELMLRISSEEDRLIDDSDIVFYSKEELMANKHKYNFYITTDFAVSDKESADHSVIAVWAVNSDGYWFWVDGSRKQTTMDVTMTDLFNFVRVYEPKNVTIEASGQQGGFIPLFEREMLSSDTWFPIQAVKPSNNKHTRFSAVVPLFKKRKIRFPQEYRGEFVLESFLREIKQVTFTGIRGTDDCLDCISSLDVIDHVYPNKMQNDLKWDIREQMWKTGFSDREIKNRRIDSYIV